MADSQVHDDAGRLLGVLTTLPDGKVEARDTLGRQRGIYDPAKNQTHDWHGRVVGNGNTLAELLGGSPPAPLPVQGPGANPGPKGGRGLRKKSGW